mmetsp:Transcript_120734/g.341430  ORF Transcript_120734/g.341430 Transcript_120734/m.341430 type:complete len:292 (+) Transcript_120734:70-945(+)
MACAATPERVLQHRVGKGEAQVEVVAITGGTPPAVVEVTGAGVAALRVSPDAVGLLTWLDEDPDALPRGNLLLLELGCGHGLTGLACAALRPEAQLVLTDVQDLLPYAERSVAANDTALMARTVVRPLPFGDAGALDEVLQEYACEGPEQPAVVALGTGIAYWECLHAPLAETLERLCAKGGEAIIGHFKRDWKVERRLWTKVLPLRGLRAEVLWEGEVGEASDVGSFAPSCTRTPGEWNARVYRVVQAERVPHSDEGAKKGDESSQAAEFEPWKAYAGTKGRNGVRTRKS